MVNFYELKTFNFWKLSTKSIELTTYIKMECYAKG